MSIAGNRLRFGHRSGGYIFTSRRACFPDDRGSCTVRKITDRRASQGGTCERSCQRSCFGTSAVAEVNEGRSIRPETPAKKAKCALACSSQAIWNLSLDCPPAVFCSSLPVLKITRRVLLGSENSLLYSILCGLSRHGVLTGLDSF